MVSLYPLPFVLCKLPLLSFFTLILVAQQSALAIPARVLIYSATQRFRHDSIPTAISALQAKGPMLDVQFDATEDKTKFDDDNLGGYDVIMFLSTTGEVLDDNEQNAFSKYLQQGGNFVGVHSASDTLVNATFYGRTVGAYFDYHAELQNATVDVLVAAHPSTSQLAEEWRVHDEMYNFKSDPRALGAIVLLSANESSYIDNQPRKFDQGSPHPIAWYQTARPDFPGRSFYTSLGHLNQTWEDPLFLSHVLGGVQWVLEGNTTRARNSSTVVGNTGTATQTSGNAGSTHSSFSPEIDTKKALHATLIVAAGFAALGWLM